MCGVAAAGAMPAPRGVGTVSLPPRAWDRLLHPREDDAHGGRAAPHPAPGESLLDPRAVEGKVGRDGRGRDIRAFLKPFIEGTSASFHVTRTKNHEPL